MQLFKSTLISNYSITLFLLFLQIFMQAQAATVPATYISSKAWGSYQMKALKGGGAMSAADLVMSFIYTTPYAITDISKISLGLAGYSYNNQYNIQYQITNLAYNGTAFTFNLQVFDTSYNYFIFFIIYSSTSASSYFDILTSSKTCTVINTGLGTTRTELMTVTSSFSSTGAGSVSVYAVLKSIKLINKVGASTDDLDFQIITPTISGTTISINIKCTKSQVTKISLAIITVLIAAKPLYLEMFSISKTTNEMSTINTGSGLCPAKFGISSLYGPNYDANCMISIQRLLDTQLGFNSPRQIQFYVSLSGGTGFTNCINSAEGNSVGSHNHYYLVVCLKDGVCPNGYYYDRTAKNCATCTVTNCSICTLTTCLTCEPTFYLSNSVTCASCTTIVSNCIDCNFTTCNQCNTTYYLDSTLNACISCSTLNNCQICSSATICTTCINNHFTVNLSNSCVSCSIVPNCVECSSYTTCTLCDTKYYLTLSGLCLPCNTSINNCLTCNGSINCTSCAPHYYIDISTNASCLLCALATSNCDLCSDNTTCNKCRLGYYPSGPSTCLLCTAKGCVDCIDPSTCMQCSMGYFLSNSFCYPCTIPNCIKCSSALVCNLCQSDYNLILNSCVCAVGKQITGVCIDVLGCVTAAKIGGVNTCIFCSNLNNFILSGATCICKVGFKLQGKQCLAYCGDGLIVGQQQCDDSNKMGGDGCSQLCKQQPNYKCGNGTVGYVCVFTANFTLTLSYILRDTVSNTAKYYLNISPSTVNFNLQSIKQNVYFNIPNGQYQVNDISIYGQILQIDIQFTNDIEGLLTTVSVGFDPNYIIANNKTITFTSTGLNAMLIITQSNQYAQYFQIIGHIVVALAGLVLIGGIIADKMIAIQTMNTLQLVYFSKLLYSQDEILISNSIQSLVYLNGFNDVGKNLSNNYQISDIYRKLGLNTDFILNYQTGLILVLMSLIIMGIYQFLKIKRMNSRQVLKMDKNQMLLELQRYQQKYNWIYERLFIVFAFVFLFQLFVSIRLQVSIMLGQIQSSNPIINVAVCVIAMTYSLSVIAFEIINPGKSNKSASTYCTHSPYYVCYYAFAFLILTPLLIFRQLFSGLVALILFAVVLISHLTTMIIWRPYQLNIHNFALIYNNSFISLFISGLIVFEFIPPIDEIQEIFMFTTFGLMISIQIIAFVRMYHALQPVKKITRSFKKDMQDLMKNKMEEARRLRLIQKDNAQYESIVNYKQNNSFFRNIQQQEEQQLNQLKRRLRKQFKEGKDML